MALGRALNLIPSVETTLSAFAPPSTPRERVDVGLLAVPRRKVERRVKPAYPREAQRLGLEAYVVLKLTVNPAGEVTETDRINGVVNLRPDEENGSARAEFYAANPYVFTIGAEGAAKKWRFESAKSSMTCFVSFMFRLTPGPDLTGNTSRPASAPLSPVPGSFKLVNVNPVYPEDARAAGVEGVVVLQITVGEDRSVTGARVVRSVPMLDQAAIDAVLQWVYEPTLLNGAPIEVESTVTINFTLR